MLLLQAREPSDPAKAEERASFAAKAGVDLERIVPHDLLQGPPTLRKVSGYDALMIGGSGDYYVSKANLPRFEAVLDLLRDVVETGHPTFASCFGFQLLVAALGGEIVHDPEGMEVGTYPLTLTEEGVNDPLFGYLPPKFLAQTGRKDRAGRLPTDTIHLASSERSPFHAFRIPGKPIWATQFHPELNAEENKARFINYLDGYGSMMSPEQQQATLDSFVESPETAELIPRFLELVSRWSS